MSQPDIKDLNLSRIFYMSLSNSTLLAAITLDSINYSNIYSIKVRLRWLGAVLHYPCKLSVFLSSLNVLTIVICNKIAKE